MSQFAHSFFRSPLKAKALRGATLISLLSLFSGQHAVANETSPLFGVNLEDLDSRERGAYVAWLSDYLSEPLIADPLVSGVNADPDDDGLSNYFEYTAKRDPMDPESTFTVDFYDDIASRLRFGPTLEDVHYDLQYSADMKAWGSHALSSVSYFGDMIETDLNETDLNRFYNVKMSRELPTADLYQFAPIPSGTFTMGSPEGEPYRATDETQHDVTLTRPYSIGTTEVTNAQVAEVLNWALGENLLDTDLGIVSNFEGDPQAFFDGNSDVHYSDFEGGLFWVQTDAENEPCVGISWYGAMAYCHYLTRKDGSMTQAVSLEDWSIDLNKTGYRLPTEAEWEYATRAGSTGAYSMNAVSPNFGFGFEYVYEFNALGLSDTHGSVGEWCYDWYASSYGGNATDPTGPETGSDRVFRDGRSADRYSSAPSSTDSDRGFRVAHSSNLSGGTAPVAISDAEIVVADNDSNGLGGEIVRLDASGSNDPDGTIVSWEWRWNGGTATGETVDVSLPTGVTEVLLTVTDDLGLSTARSVRVNVTSYTDPAGDSELIPAGSFLMGSASSELVQDSDESQHEVTLTRAFHMNRLEVTNEQMVEVLNWALAQNLVEYDASSQSIKNLEGDTQQLLVLRNRNSQISFSEGTLIIVDAPANSPCVYVSWYGAMAYCHFLTRMSGNVSQAIDLNDWSIDFSKTGYRLPSEAEWEYACRAGTNTTIYSGGWTQEERNPFVIGLHSSSWFRENSNPNYAPIASHSVGTKDYNPWGLHDTIGNVAEWCYDWYAFYNASTTTDPTGPTFGSRRVHRGGSWDDGYYLCRAANRSSSQAHATQDTVGFRVARSASPTAMIAAAGPDIHELDTDDHGFVTISLNASESSDWDGTIVAWDWSWTGGAASGETAEASFPVGQTLVSLTVTDNTGETATDTVSINVRPAIEPLALIPNGTFTMGAPDNEPGVYYSSDETQHKVTLTNPFYIGTTEVTNQQMVDVLNWALAQGLLDANSDTVSNAEGDPQTLLNFNREFAQIRFEGNAFVVDNSKKNHPCIEVSWHGAMAYCHYLTRKQGSLTQAVDLSDWSADFSQSGYRLPTEAQWEYAARAGTTTSTYAGNNSISADDPNFDQIGWYIGNSEMTTHVVAQKAANAWGLFDTHGNVDEWCYDWFGPYSAIEATNPTGPDSGAKRIIRGGNWNSYSTQCRSASRYPYTTPSDSNLTTGFRVALGTDTVLGTAPSALVGASTQLIDTNGNGSESVLLSAEASSDPDGTIVSWKWSWSEWTTVAEELVFSPKTQSGATLQADFPIGKTAVTLTVTDDDGLIGQDTVAITVREAIPEGEALIPAGTFTMGTPPPGEYPFDEEQHQVTLTHPFYMGKTEVTNGQLVSVLNWALGQGLLNASPSSVTNTEGDSKELFFNFSYHYEIKYSGTEFVVFNGRNNNRCSDLTWFGALAYCNYLTRMEGGLTQAIDLSDWSVDFSKTGYRLPTEAEWEYACRAGTTTEYYTGSGESRLGLAAWYYGNSGWAEIVGKKQPNAWGLFDMHGSVDEWCYDWYNRSYGGDAVDPTGQTSGSRRVIRGGNLRGSAADCRSANRDYYNSTRSTPDIGFRIVRSSNL